MNTEFNVDPSPSPQQDIVVVPPRPDRYSIEGNLALKTAIERVSETASESVSMAAMANHDSDIETDGYFRSEYARQMLVFSEQAAELISAANHLRFMLPVAASSLL